MNRCPKCGMPDLVLVEKGSGCLECGWRSPGLLVLLQRVKAATEAYVAAYNDRDDAIRSAVAAGVDTARVAECARMTPESLDWLLRGAS